MDEYVLDDRRTDIYTFSSRKDLIRFFSYWLDKKDIEMVIESAGINFTIRNGCTKTETELQFIKKCEYRLVKMLKDKNQLA